MNHLVQVALFGVMACAIVATALVLATVSHQDRTGFGRRLPVFFNRYCLPEWGLMELAVWALADRLYPS